MNSEKNRKSHSMVFKLTVPMAAVFSFFVLLVSLVAYFIYSSSVRTNSLNQIKSTSEQVQTNYETYFESVINVSDNVQVRIDNEDVINNVGDVEVYFNQLLSFKSDISNICIYNLSGKPIVSDSDFAPVTVDTSEDWFSSSLTDKLINFFSRVDKSSDASYFFTLSKYVSFNKGKDEGVMKIQFDFAKIIELISQTDLGTGGHITIYDKKYEVVYSSEALPSGEKARIKDLVIGTETYSESGTEYVLYLSTIQNTTWKVAIITNNNSMNSVINLFLISVIFIAIGSTAVFSLLIYFLSRGLTKPMTKLSNEMASIENFNYDASKADVIKGSIEIESLDRSFIQMMNRIKELMNKVLEEQSAQRKSELKALQNQINPHFLYNTLDSILYLIDKNENQKAEMMILALSKFFRISISKGKNIIPLPKEIEHGENYLIIQKMRYGDQFNYKIDVEPGLEKYFVIKLILQPIIENAIAHGFNDQGGKDSFITIKVYRERDLIKFSISDNGYGILPEKIEEIYQSFNDRTIYKGVGLKNVYQRIKIFYGPKADVRIESELDKGTTVIISIPEEGALKDDEE